MSIDRASALRSAEKLLRQGRLDQAIAEYLRMVEGRPRDWSTADTLGELCVRASTRPSMDSAEQDSQPGLALCGAGQFEDAEPALERASRTPRFRLEAAFALGLIGRARGRTWAAIDWLERAAQAPPSSCEQGHRLLFGLADLLESVGEVARALAVALELQPEAGAYEDVDARVERLAKVQAPG